MIIADHLKEFVEYLEIVLGRRRSTVKRYARNIELFDHYLKKRGGAGGNEHPDVVDVTQADIEAWLKSLFFQQGNLQNITRATKLAAIKAFWKFLLYRGYVKEDLIARVPTPKTSRPLPQKFSTKHLRRIFAAPDISTDRGLRDVAILKLLYAAGPRVSEIAGLDLGDIHEAGDNFYIHFRDTKGGKDRIVRLRKSPTDTLAMWLVVREGYAPPEEQAVFIALKKKPRTRLSTVSYNAILKKYAAQVGIKTERVFVHKMRATFATDLYDLGFGVKEISVQMGHTSVESTERYIAISDTALKKTAIPEKRWRQLEKKEDEL